MKLLDQVAQAKLALDIEDDTGRYELPGVGELASAVTACPTRFIAEPNVARYCASLLATEHGMLAACNEYLRVPACQFWLEWPCVSAGDTMPGLRTGVLVQADDGGRRGRLAVIWEQPLGEPLAAQMIVSFDLDHDLYRKAENECFALCAGSHPLAAHLLFAFKPDWQRHLGSLSEGDILAAAGQIVSTMLADIEFLLVFSALLAERTCLRQNHVDMSRLNCRRSDKGKPPLLDHAEVRLDLVQDDGGHPRDAGDRKPARLHTVRGHMVHRSGHAFWRRSHLRGDPSRPGWVRTVRVTR